MCVCVSVMCVCVCVCVCERERGEKEVERDEWIIDIDSVMHLCQSIQSAVSEALLLLCFMWISSGLTPDQPLGLTTTAHRRQSGRAATLSNQWETSRHYMNQTPLSFLRLTLRGELNETRKRKRERERKPKPVTRKWPVKQATSK